jgi:hypothetical protein
MDNSGTEARVGRKNGRLWVQWVNLVFIFSAAAEQSVTLAWDPNTEPDLAGYVLYYGTNSGDYRHSIQVGNVTLATVPGLSEGTTYFFAVTAVNQFGAESDFSDEVGYTVPWRERAIQTMRLDTNQNVVVTVHSAPGIIAILQTSTDLQRWRTVDVVTNLSGMLEYTASSDGQHRFYRWISP